MEDDQNRRRPKWKSTKMKDDQNGIRPKWKTTRMEDEQSVILLQIKYNMVRGKVRLTLLESGA